MKKIVILITWFGPWPKWMGLYLESCRYNPTIDFVLVSDAPVPADLPPNVRVLSFSFAEYRDHVAGRLGITAKWDSAYKLCDMKPAMAFIHEDLVAGYDNWGFGDIDVIYGDLRRFLDDDALDHDVISTDRRIVAGHFCVVRNSPEMVNAFKRPLHWRWLLSTAEHKCYDERIFSMMFEQEEGRRKHGLHHRLLTPRIGGALFQEQHSTALPSCTWIDGSRDFPQTWYWNRGHLTADNAGDREFMYLHFSHWASKRWAGGDKAVWDAADPLVGVTDPHPTSFKISAEGFRDWAPADEKVPEPS
jgi:hypothetical protein